MLPQQTNIFTSEHYTHLARLAHYFETTDRGAIAFATCSHYGVRREVNEAIIERLAANNKEIAVAQLPENQDSPLLDAPGKAVKKGAQGLIFSGFDELYSNLGNDAIAWLNQARERIWALDVPVMIWMEDKTLTALATHGMDLYSRRERGIFHFAAPINPSPVDAMREKLSPEYISTEDYKRNELKIKILEDQLREAEKKKYPKKAIVDDIVLDLMGLYVDSFLPLEAEKLTNKYRKEMDVEDKTKHAVALAKVLAFNHHYEDAIEILHKRLDKLHKIENSLEQVNIYDWLAWNYNSVPDYDKAIEYYEKALEIDLKVHSENHPSVATRYNNLGSAFDSKGQYDKAIEYYENALEIDLKMYGENHPDIAMNYNNLGLAYNNKSQYDKAIDYYEKALEIDLIALGENHPNVAIRYNNLGLAWYSKGQYDKAIEYYEKALEIILKVYGEYHPHTAGSYNNLGSAWDSKDQYDKAIEYYEKALEIDLKMHGEQHPATARDYNNLGSTWYSKGQYDKAIEYYEKALEIDLKAHDENHPDIAIDYNNLGSTWDSKGQSNKAIEYYKKALKIDLKVHGENHPETAIRYNNLGGALKRKGQYNKAIEYYEKSLEIAKKTLGQDHPNTITVLNNLNSLKNKPD